MATSSELEPVPVAAKSGIVSFGALGTCEVKTTYLSPMPIELLSVGSRTVDVCRDGKDHRRTKRLRTLS